MDIPKHRTDIWEKFHPDNFPVWSYRKGDGDQYVFTCKLQTSISDCQFLEGITKEEDFLSLGKADSNLDFLVARYAKHLSAHTTASTD